MFTAFLSKAELPARPLLAALNIATNIAAVVPDNEGQDTDVNGV